MAVPAVPVLAGDQRYATLDRGAAMKKLYTDGKGHTRSYEYREPMSEKKALLIAVIVVVCLVALLIYGINLIK